MIVFRIEHKESGLGPYINGDVKPNTYLYRTPCPDSYLSCPQKIAELAHVNLLFRGELDNKRYWKFSFRTWTILVRRVRKARKKLKKKGYVVRCYSVKEFIRGKEQVIFNSCTARLVREFDLENLT